MNSFNVDHIKQESIDILLPLWKNYSGIYSVLQKQSKGACILLDWITAYVELKIKKETFNSVKKNLLDVEYIKEYFK